MRAYTLHMEPGWLLPSSRYDASQHPAPGPVRSEARAQRLAEPPLRAPCWYLHNCWLGALAAGVEILLHMTLRQLS